MAKFFESISDEHREFIEKQHMFFVASAPLSAEGHVNVSPKGLDCLRVLGANQVGYADMTGSGNETSAHLLENGRITLMFCSFTGTPQIMRLYGTGRTVLPGSPEWDEYASNFEIWLGVRQIIVADIDTVQTSCGYAVPLMDFREDRQTLHKYWDAKGEEALAPYQALKNACSLDGLPSALGASLAVEES